jgi:hypothetical protein
MHTEAGVPAQGFHQQFLNQCHTTSYEVALEYANCESREI